MKRSRVGRDQSNHRKGPGKNAAREKDFNFDKRQKKTTPPQPLHRPFRGEERDLAVFSRSSARRSRLKLRVGEGVQVVRKTSYEKAKGERERVKPSLRGPPLTRVSRCGARKKSHGASVQSRLKRKESWRGLLHSWSFRRNQHNSPFFQQGGLRGTEQGRNDSLPGNTSGRGTKG